MCVLAPDANPVLDVLTIWGRTSPLVYWQDGISLVKTRATPIAHSPVGSLRRLDGPRLPAATVALDIFSDGGSTPPSVTAGHDTLIRDIGSASTVLLKNTRNTLPFKKPTSLALIGSAATSNLLGPNASVRCTTDAPLLTDKQLHGPHMQLWHPRVRLGQRVGCCPARCF
jgi:hypothetical protein